MKIRWSAEALDDVDRLVDFIAVFDPSLALDVEEALSQAPRRLLNFPRLGSRLSEFKACEVREMRVRRYLLRYQLIDDDIRVLRVFHAREDRQRR